MSDYTRYLLAAYFLTNLFSEYETDTKGVSSVVERTLLIDGDNIIMSNAILLSNLPETSKDEKRQVKTVYLQWSARTIHGFFATRLHSLIHFIVCSIMGERLEKYNLRTSSVRA